MCEQIRGHLNQAGSKGFSAEVQCTMSLQHESMNTSNFAQLRVVIGSGGGLGQAWLGLLQAQDAGSKPTTRTVGLSRSTTPPIDFTQPATLEAASVWLKEQLGSSGSQLRQMVVATGFLHSDELGQPERSWRQLDATYLQHVMQVNAIGPALLIRALFDVLPKSERVVVAFLSAKVGSIGDNALGGWYGYRASKAALNQFVKTASIELRRHNKDAVCVALHPGTVDTDLSKPFAKKGLHVRTASVAAQELQAVLDQLGPAQTGQFFDYQGHALPW